MQQFGMQQPEVTRSSGASKIIVVAVLLFALAGLMMGLAVGTFTRTHNPPHQPPISQQRSGSTPTPVQNFNINAVGGVGCPTITPPPYSETADGATPYQLSATIKDRSISQAGACGQGNPIKAPGGTCKIWVTNTTGAKLPNDLFQPVSNMQNTFPDEIQNALTFTSGSQVQDCSPTGTTTWSYKLSPTLKPGTYFLGVAVNWQGISWNWSYQQFGVPNQ